MPIRHADSSSILLATGQLTQYSSELDDGYYKKGKPKVYDILTTGQYDGTTNIDVTYLVSDTAAFTASSHTITDTGKCGVFKAGGGETIIISGATDPLNNGTFTSASATADTLVLTDGLADESAGATITVKKRGALSNNCVFDRRTKLMWARYCSVLQGIAGNGLMPWTGTSYDAFDFCAAANLAGLGGYNDWRIPNKIELISLINEETNGAPDATAFPSWPCDATLTNAHWTSTTYKYSTILAVAVRFGDGGVAAKNKTSTAQYCALVRGF